VEIAGGVRVNVSYVDDAVCFHGASRPVVPARIDNVTASDEWEWEVVTETSIKSTLGPGAIAELVLLSVVTAVLLLLCCRRGVVALRHGTCPCSSGPRWRPLVHRDATFDGAVGGGGGLDGDGDDDGPPLAASVGVIEMQMLRVNN
jgi:hypothetical protein